MYSNLTSEQQDAYSAMLKGHNVFVTGGGGVGKSALIKYFYHKNKYNKKIALTSTTGISSVNIGGKTIHSFSGIGTGQLDVETYIHKLKWNKKVRKRWQNVNVLIIDEVSMLSKDIFQKLETIARLFRGNSTIFGGIQIIASGDFYQLPCIKGEFCFKSERWNKCFQIHFISNKLLDKEINNSKMY